jgi:hypothetical protein
VGRLPAWAAVTAVLLAAGCGGHVPAPAQPPAGSVAERQWIDNATRLVAELNADINLSASGGADLATARHAMSDESDIYTMLVAYSLFGDCGRTLAAVGSPSQRTQHVVAIIISACGRLERASTLFQRAMTGNRAEALLAATRTAAGAAPILARASVALARLRT